jgi:hypothetical protein
MSFIMSRSGGLKQHHTKMASQVPQASGDQPQAKQALQNISVSDLLKLSPQEIRNSLNAQQPTQQKTETSSMAAQPSVMVCSGANIMNKPYGVTSTIPVFDMY